MIVYHLITFLKKQDLKSLDKDLSENIFEEKYKHET